MPRKISFHLALSCVIAPALLAGAQGRAPDVEFFEQFVRPMLAENCYRCHGIDQAKGGLRLDTGGEMFRGGDHGPALISGEPDKSLLLRTLRQAAGDPHGLPEHKALSESQIAGLAAWISVGAPRPREAGNPAGGTNAPTSTYNFTAARAQWAFHAPADPPVPAVKNQRWAKSPIDGFILAKLEEKDLPPSAPADKRALIRRATFDLTGLPPTPGEVAAFLRDESADAFAKVVDRLLASPRYGERWARHWLDVVRYADSLDARGIGGEGDIAEAWRYRDWVVRAFNSDLPYDQFIRQQIAGDLLQPAEPDQIDTNGIIATGMYAIGNWGNGDADKEKLLTDIADDQVDVTGRAFLGLTLACARCHDHKFDPIPTADYYSLAGIFFSSHILPKLTPKGQGEVLLRIPLASRAELAARKEREARMVELEKQITTTTDAELASFIKKTLPQTADYLSAVADYRNRNGDPVRPEAAASATDQPDARAFQPIPGLLQQWVDYLGFGEFKLLPSLTRDLAGQSGLYVLRNASNADTPACTINTTDKEVAFSTIKMPPRTVAIHPSPNAGVAVGWKSPITGTIQITGGVIDADPNCGDGIEWRLDLRGAGGPRELASGAIPNGGAQLLRDGKGATNLLAIAVHEGEVIQLGVFPKAEYSCDTTLIDLNITERGGAGRMWNAARDLVAEIKESRNPFPDAYGHAAVWQMIDLDGQAAMGLVVAGSPLASWFDLLAHHAPEPDMEQAAKVIQQALLSPDATNGTSRKLHQDLTMPRSPFWAAARNVEDYFPEASRTNLGSLKSELARLKQTPSPPLLMALGLQDGGVPESPQAGTHDVRIHQRGRYDRLGEMVPRRFPRLLAGDDQTPVTEGSGRMALAKWVAGAENPLTARVMVNRIWQHHFGEGIVRTPNNFGKLGTPPTHPELLDFLAHRFIESGWSVKALHRMIMLSAAYQQSSIPDPATLKADPDNLWFGRMNRRRLESEALRDSLLAVAGRLDPAMGGPAIADLTSARRTLYVMTVRSDRATYQFLFDAADPGTIAEKRIDSTVAPQALFLLNHPFVLAQVKALVQRLPKEAPADDRGRIEWLYAQLYGRPASLEEIEIGAKALAQTTRRGQGPDSAWEQYCQTLLCANEFIYVD